MSLGRILRKIIVMGLMFEIGYCSGAEHQKAKYEEEYGSILNNKTEYRTFINKNQINQYNKHNYYALKKKQFKEYYR